MKYKGIVFDLDGTLIDTLGDIAAAINKTLGKYGYRTWPVESYRERIGWGLQNALKSSLPEKSLDVADIKAMTDDVIIFYHAAPATHTTVYAGMLKLLDQLKLTGIKTAIWTNKDEGVAREVIRTKFPVHYTMFSLILGDSEKRARKPDPEGSNEILASWMIKPEEVIYLGDTDVDMETAIASGFKPYGVSWGYRTKESLYGAGALKVFDRPVELLDIISP